MTGFSAAKAAKCPVPLQLLTLRLNNFPQLCGFREFLFQQFFGHVTRKVRKTVPDIFQSRTVDSLVIEYNCGYSSKHFACAPLYVISTRPAR
jgi:hypothetical protein